MVVFTEEHQAFRTSVRAFVDREIEPHVDDWERAGRMPTHELFAQLGELGFLGLEYDPAYGGGGADHLFAVVLAEEIGRVGAAGVGMAIAVQTDMATPSLHRFGSEELKQTYLAPAIRGETVTAIAVTEPDAGSDVAGLRTRAVRDGDDWVINGSKLYITNGAQADWLCLLARTSDEGGTRVQPDRRADVDAGRGRVPHAPQARQPLLGHRGAVVHRRPRPDVAHHRSRGPRLPAADGAVPERADGRLLRPRRGVRGLG